MRARSVPATRHFTVTITGADDLVDPATLLALSREFPFVEWGILLSLKRAGTPRYPTMKWVRLLPHTIPAAKLSLHLCGEVARLAADARLSGVNGVLGYDRIQVNGYESHWRHGLHGLFTSEVILQARSAETLQAVANDALSIRGASVLFDPSGGKGLEPFAWPRAPLGVKVGYAGGIGPTNVEAAIQAILEANGFVGGPFWIDMESGVRDEKDCFRVSRVREVLERCARVAEELERP